MSDKTAIRVDHLGKKYKVGRPQEKYLTLRDAVVNSVKVPFRKFQSAPSSEEFWALKDVSFNVEQGEVVGIIGRNGAGKSTLLKILSRITTPTEGTVELHGRVGSLLEVGTGFHPELTGRENIFLSGSILGMKKREIEGKLDDIVKFSEIEKFLDTPVKRYSSGMYVRLAFAVAAHMDTEILLVDEVLAVGDAAFQKKCMGKMGDVAKEGRTVLFVSHNMGALKSLCSRAIQIKNGKNVADGLSYEVVNGYLAELDTLQENGDQTHRLFRQGTGEIIITLVRFLDEFCNPITRIYSGQKCYIEVSYKSNTGTPNPHIVFGISFYHIGCHLISLSSSIIEKEFSQMRSTGKVYCFVNSLPLAPGIYSYNIICTLASGTLDHITDAGKITVTESDFFGTGKILVNCQQGVLICYDWLTERDMDEQRKCEVNQK
jgi:lipopolysaccharide transport system ATP-binding protein